MWSVFHDSILWMQPQQQQQQQQQQIFELKGVKPQRKAKSMMYVTMDLFTYASFVSDIVHI